MIELKQLSHHYGLQPTLHDVNLVVKPGELAVVVGPNGIGKSTLLGLIAGVLTPWEGEVWVAGKRRRGSVDDELEIRRQSVYLPAMPFLPLAMTGREFLIAVGRIYEVPWDRLFAQVDRLFSLFQLADRSEAAISSYSTGQQKKLSLCAALLPETPILILDEPFSGGLDPAGLMVLKRLLKRRVQEKQHCVILSSPVPEIVEEIADRIVILKEGTIAASESMEGLRQKSGIPGTLGQILEQMLYPEVQHQINTYFSEVV